MPLTHSQNQRIAVSLIVGVDAEVLDINLRHSRNDQLELLFREDGDEGAGDDVVETAEQRVQLLLDHAGHAVGAPLSDEVLLVGVGHWDVLTARNQLNLIHVAERLVGNGEVQTQIDLVDVDGEKLLHILE